MLVLAVVEAKVRALETDPHQHLVLLNQVQVSQQVSPVEPEVVEVPVSYKIPHFIGEVNNLRIDLDRQKVFFDEELLEVAL